MSESKMPNISTASSTNIKTETGHQNQEVHEEGHWIPEILETNSENRIQNKCYLVQTCLH